MALNTGAATPPADAHLSYQEILRIIGNMLAEVQAEWAVINLEQPDAPVCATIAADNWRWPIAWTIDQLKNERAAQRQATTGANQLTAAPDFPTPGADRRVAEYLRVVGAALDLQPLRAPYTIEACTVGVRVDGLAGRLWSFSRKELERRVTLAPHLRGQLAPPPG